MGDTAGTDSPPTFPPPPPFKPRVGPVGIGVAIGLSVILLLILYCVLKRKAKCCKCCKKPTLKDRIRKKMGLKKRREPFSVSGILDRK